MSQILAFQSGALQSSRSCCNAGQQRGHAAHRAHLAQRGQRRQLVVRAKEDGEEKGKKIDNRKVTEKTNKLVEGMKKGGIDQDTAQRILDTWEKTGATSTDALRRLLLGRSLRTVGVVLFQLALDAGAAYGSYNSARRAVHPCSVPICQSMHQSAMLSTVSLLQICGTGAILWQDCLGVWGILPS